MFYNLRDQVPKKAYADLHIWYFGDVPKHQKEAFGALVYMPFGASVALLKRELISAVAFPTWSSFEAGALFFFVATCG